MKSSFYSVKDCKVGGFFPPFCLVNDVAAVRIFGYSVNDKTVQTTLSLYPNDFELWKVAEFDSDSGIVTPLGPIFVCNAISTIKPVDPASPAAK